MKNKCIIARIITLATIVLFLFPQLSSALPEFKPELKISSSYLSHGEDFYWHGMSFRSTILQNFKMVKPGIGIMYYARGKRYSNPKVKKDWLRDCFLFSEILFYPFASLEPEHYNHYLGVRMGIHLIISKYVSEGWNVIGEWVYHYEESEYHKGFGYDLFGGLRFTPFNKIPLYFFVEGSPLSTIPSRRDEWWGWYVGGGLVYCFGKKQ
ncbi:MAG: hypothetical protein AB1393_09560 [Candidatus Edwardsbacteria bacterium]